MYKPNKDIAEGLTRLFDNHCEPKVTKTDQHPNCEYIFSCEEVDELMELILLMKKWAIKVVEQKQSD